MCERQRSFNYDRHGRRVNPQGGHYMIPADQFARVVEMAQWDPRILNCFPFVPLPAPGPRCPPAPPRPNRPVHAARRAPTTVPWLRRR